MASVIIERLQPGNYEEDCAALKANRGYHERRGSTWTGGACTKAIIGTLLTGYPSWLPKKLKVFD